MSNPEPAPDGPSPLSASPLPSSFDSDPDFFEESRFQKLWRKIRQEPLIPVGCAATCYALYMATKSIRQGDHHQTNRMFRARIYAQGFTLLALVAGSIFYKDERVQRKKFEAAVEEKKTAEKRDKWIQELEARDREDQMWRERIEAQSRDAAIAVELAENPANHGSLNIMDQIKAHQTQNDPIPDPDPQESETIKQKRVLSWFGKKDSDS